MTIGNNKVVSVLYDLTVTEDNQEILVESVDKEKPYNFVFGSGQLLESFEKELEGKTAGESFDFTIDAENGYGQRQADLIAAIPKDSFIDEEGNFDEEMIQPGRVLPMVTTEGNQIQGIVVETNPENVIMDFNHPLAEKTLKFKGNVVEVREATQEELNNPNFDNF